ncbi:hypothetical protein HUU05_04750 [candidate division KSB1 bacterium]|nr:hypothetical protein [candidate division KSB1 bacterium]
MSYQNDREKDIRNDLYKLRRDSRERYLKLLGVDVAKLRDTERAIDNDFGQLVAKLQETRREDGKARAERQARLLRAGQAALNTDAEAALHADLSNSNAILAHLNLDQIDPSIVSALWFCHCHYTMWLFNNVGNGDDISIDPPNGGTGVASVNYEIPLNEAQPYADVHGGGTGTVNTATASTFYKFAFNPASSGTYCIRPFVSMSGWWLLWTWGACGGSSEDLGEGTVRVKLRVRVDQLSETVREQEHIVLEEHRAGGLDAEGAVDYVSTSDNGGDVSVYLEGGHETVIFVECELFTQISNHGRAIIDMQSGSGFYFRVQPVAIGKRHCHWPWPLIDDFTIRPVLPRLPQ